MAHSSLQRIRPLKKRILVSVKSACLEVVSQALHGSNKYGDYAIGPNVWAIAGESGPPLLPRKLETYPISGKSTKLD